MELFPETRTEELRRVSLVRLSGEIARSVAAIGRVVVEGEVVRPKITGGGGAFFTLRDRVSQVTVRCPSSRMARCRAVHGERVAVTGAVEYANDRGELRLVAEEVAPVGEGAINALLTEVRARLTADGLVDRPRRALPRLPALIAVVCGTEAAIRADMESVVAARFPGYPIEFVEVAVSGPGAADSVMAAMAALDRRPEVEVIVLARGGGDASQLLPFSDESLCRAVAGCGTPVVSAIGHDGDRPLCDLVADLRCGTPSLAAGAVVPDRHALEAELDALASMAATIIERRMETAGRRVESVRPDAALRAGLERAEARVRGAVGRMHLVHPERTLVAAADRLVRLDWYRPLAARHARADAELAGHRRHLDALSPARVLERGYAVVRTPDGTVVRDAAAVRPGDELAVTLAAGTVRTRVEEAVGG